MSFDTVLKILTEKKYPKIKPLALTKGMDMGIWVVGTSNHLFIRDSYNETKFSKKTNKLKSDSHLPKTIF